MDIEGNERPGAENSCAKALGREPAMFRAQRGWAEGAGRWVRDAAGKLDHDNIGPGGGRGGLFRVRRERAFQSENAAGGVF